MATRRSPATRLAQVPAVFMPPGDAQLRPPVRDQLRPGPGELHTEMAPAAALRPFPTPGIGRLEVCPGISRPVSVLFEAVA